MPSNLGDTTTCAHCGGVVVNVGPDTWDHVDAADHRAAPTTLREQGLTDALRHMTHEAARHYAKRRANAKRAWRYRREARRCAHIAASLLDDARELNSLRAVSGNDDLVSLALRLMLNELPTSMDESRRLRQAVIAGLRTQLRDLEESLLFEYTGRMAAEARVDALEEAIAVHRRDTAAGCQVDAALWRHLEGGT